MAEAKKTFLDTLDEATKKIAIGLKKAHAAYKVAMAAVTLSEVNTEDGKVLKFEGELAEKTVVTLVTAEGETPAPAADYKLEDGTVVTVDDKSTVTKITPKAAEEKDETKTEMSKVEFAEMVKALPTKADFIKLNAEVKKVNAENAAYKIKLSKQEVLLGDLVDVVDAFMKLPTADAIEAGGSTDVEFKELSEDELSKLTSAQKHKYEKKLRDHKYNTK